MKIFDIYRYSNPHKGYGYGEHQEYFLLDDSEFEQEYEDEAPSNSHVGEQIATEAGYKGYDYTAREVQPHELREERNELMDKAREIERVLGAADEKSGSSNDELYEDTEIVDAPHSETDTM